MSCLTLVTVDLHTRPQEQRQLLLLQ